MNKDIRLIDADVVVYRAGFAAEKKKYVVHFGDAVRVHVDSHREAMGYMEGNADATLSTEHIVEPVENALHNTNSLMQRLTDGFRYEAFLTGQGNFRKDLATLKKYKGNRDKAAKPVHYDSIRSHLVNRWGARVIDGMEADDEIGIRMYELSKEGFEPTIVSNDKDLKMLEGRYYNWTKDEYFTISKEDAWRAYYEQCLVGDTTDNIPGVAGIGVKTAAKLLASCKGAGEMREKVRRIWHEHYPQGYMKEDGETISTEEAFREVAELLWIRRKR